LPNICDPKSTVPDRSREAGRFEAIMFDRKDVAGAFWREAAIGWREEKCSKKTRWKPRSDSIGTKKALG
jgi:hypothetical protein